MPLTVAEIDRRLRALYGEVDWAGATGVVHVAAIAASSRQVIVPGAAAPSSETDCFVLGAARARADAILTTGAILRSEPALQHDFAVDEMDDRAFLEWRRETLGRVERPMLIVLTESGDLPIDHPALARASRGFFWTTSKGAQRLRATKGTKKTGLEIVVGEPSSTAILPAIRSAMARSEIETVLVEVGPRGASPLYAHAGERPDAQLGRADIEEPLRCDELLLSRFRGVLAPDAIGPAFFTEESVHACYVKPPSERQVEESSGTWTFCRYRDS